MFRITSERPVSDPVVSPAPIAGTDRPATRR
jgi:hypothetical protein